MVTNHFQVLGWSSKYHPHGPTWGLLLHPGKWTFWTQSHGGLVHIPLDGFSAELRYSIRKWWRWSPRVDKLELVSGFPLKATRDQKWDCEMMSEYSCLFQLLYYIYIIIYIIYLKYSVFFGKMMSYKKKSKTRGAREPKSKPLVEKNKCVRFESLLTSLVPCLQRLHIFFHIFFPGATS